MTKPAEKKLVESTRGWLQSTTATYFAKAQQGNKDAMEDLIRRIQQRLVGFCLHLTNNKQLAQDLSQDIYLKMLENIDSLANPNYVIPWVYRIARNHYIDYLRSSHVKSVKYVPEIPDNVLVYQPSNSIDMEIPATLQNLDPEERFLLVIVYVEGCTYREAAEITGSTEQAVRSKIYRLKKSFAKKTPAHKKVAG